MILKLSTSEIFIKTKNDIKETTNFCKYILKSDDINPIMKGLVIGSTFLSIGIIYSSIPFHTIGYTVNKFKSYF